MEAFYFVIGWGLSLGGLFAIHKLILVAEKYEG
jgi:hypothetical protein